MILRATASSSLNPGRNALPFVGLSNMLDGIATKEKVGRAIL